MFYVHQFYEKTDIQTALRMDGVDHQGNHNRDISIALRLGQNKVSKYLLPK